MSDAKLSPTQEALLGLGFVLNPAPPYNGDTSLRYCLPMLPPNDLRVLEVRYETETDLLSTATLFHRSDDKHEIVGNFGIDQDIHSVAVLAHLMNGCRTTVLRDEAPVTHGAMVLLGFEQPFAHVPHLVLKISNRSGKTVIVYGTGPYPGRINAPIFLEIEGRRAKLENVKTVGDLRQLLSFLGWKGNG